jgi:hypothetical protein
MQQGMDASIFPSEVDKDILFPARLQKKFSIDLSSLLSNYVKKG